MKATVANWENKCSERHLLGSQPYHPTLLPKCVSWLYTHFSQQLDGIQLNGAEIFSAEYIILFFFLVPSVVKILSVKNKVKNGFWS